jgi:uncharacterized protein (DUF362 family)
MALAEIEFSSYDVSVPAALDALHAAQVLAGQARVLIKPNLVNCSPPPVTTPVACVAAVIAYVRAHAAAEIIVAEGCGAADCETADVFEALGYHALAQRLGVALLDLNTADTVVVRDPGCRIFPRFHLPVIANEAFIISVPVLKAHSLAGITGTLKNMMGFAPPRHYQQGGYWKKSAFHARMHQSIVELNRYCRADLSVMDATIGLAEFHLGGPECSPPVNKILAGFDPLELDRRAAELLSLDWKEIPHLAGE